MNDSQIKKALGLSILLGVVLGGAWGLARYSLTDVRAWNLAGLGVIVCVALYAGGFALVRLSKRNA